jgi:hypothetical protein
MLRIDPWLTNLVGGGAYVATFPITKKDISQIDRNPIFITAKTSVNDQEGIIQAQQFGFLLIDTNIQLEKYILANQGQSVEAESKGGIRFANQGDRNTVEQISRQEFMFDRFHMDPNISNIVASNIKAEWASNYFAGKRGDWMIVSEGEDGVNGFLQLLAAENNQTLVIDLIAVSSQMRGQGIALGMIKFAISTLGRSFTKIQVGTQVGNYPSLSLYISAGFKVVQANYIWHSHVIPEINT